MILQQINSQVLNSKANTNQSKIPFKLTGSVFDFSSMKCDLTWLIKAHCC